MVQSLFDSVSGTVDQSKWISEIGTIVQCTKLRDFQQKWRLPFLIRPPYINGGRMGTRKAALKKKSLTGLFCRMPLGFFIKGVFIAHNCIYWPDLSFMSGSEEWHPEAAAVAAAVSEGSLMSWPPGKDSCWGWRLRATPPPWWCPFILIKWKIK